MGKVAAGKVGRRVGLDPGNIVQQLEAQLLHGEADRMDDVRGAADPDGAVGFQHALAGRQPGAIEFVVGVWAARAIPLALVHAHHAPGVAGDAVVGKEIGWVGENQVHTLVGNPGQDLQAVALKDLEAVFQVLKDRGRQLRQPISENVCSLLPGPVALVRHSLFPSFVVSLGSLIGRYCLSR